MASTLGPFAQPLGCDRGRGGPLDRKIMRLAAILPMISQKVLLYRNPNVTNLYVEECFGMYDYALLGVR